MVLQGFKSFARKTEIPFENAMNVIVGPNGSGKSNITDALCFVLGRMSIKSIRAAKAANLLFAGTKNYKGVNEAFVELIFDNSDGAFSINSTEVSIKRVLRRNGLSIYKINNETKTRQELIELIAQAGIDPNGFNIVLQGNITELVKMGPDERRKILEEVAGISIYETRKVKSLAELEKAEEKLKEVSAILREKNSYLKNLEKDRQDALNYQKIEQTIKKCKATVISKTIKEREKELWAVDKLLENNKKEIDERKRKIKEKDTEVRTIQDSINEVNKQIQSSTGEEQEILHKEISELKSLLGAAFARRENFENRIDQNREREINLKEKIKELEEEVQKIQVTSPEIKKQQTVLKELQEKFDALEKQRRTFYMIKSDLSTLENRKEEKNRTLIGYNKELEIIERNINQVFSEIKHDKSLTVLVSLKEKAINEIKHLKDKKIELEKEILELEKSNAVLFQIINRERKLKGDIIGLDVCPMCRNKITEEHRCYVVDNSNSKMKNAEEESKKNAEKIKELTDEINVTLEKAMLNEQKQKEVELDIIKIRSTDDKKENIKRLMSQKQETEESLKEIVKKLTETKEKFEELKNVEEKYDEARMRIQELSLYSKVDVDTNVALKQRELERIKVEIKTLARDTEETQRELKAIIEKQAENEKILDKKDLEEQKLYEKYQKLYTVRNELQDKQKAIETTIMGLQHEIRNIEEKVGSINIQKAQHQAQLENLKIEFKELENIEQINLTVEQAREKIQESQMRLNQLGTINLKAVEIYDQVKLVCDQIVDKVNTIISEKEKVTKIIGEIDKKKKKSFMKTLEAVNILFTRNFTQLSRKGEVFLDLENKEDPFAGGLNILVKVGKGKYFDITSLSGGEKTLVALSLIFAIQEYKPYCFYIFDEIDAALDKHNSELLAALIKRYMLSGQYIVITHNDALISEATTLYGVSMQEGLSQVISLKI
ncbi:MAG: chromosome segregation SMC family protein [archaeon]